MKRAKTGLTISALALCLGACAADVTNYPSLARRDAERAPEVAQPAPAPAAVPQGPSAGLAERLAFLVNQARTAHDKFASRRNNADRAVGSGRGGRGSEGWSVASIALADLESARSDAMIALADLDELHAAARTAIDAGGGDDQAIAAARDQVSAWIGEEDQVLAGLRRRLGG